MQWNKEVQVDEWVREKLKSIGLKLGKDFLEKDASAYLKDALKGASKTKKQTGTGIPDFVIEKYKVDNEIIPVIFECKLGVGKLEKYAKDNEKALDFSNDAISKYALNGALHYARVALQNESQKQDHYKEIIAIGIAGDNSQNVRVKIACVFADSSLAYKEIKRANLDFLENAKSFTHFYKEECKLTEEDRHLILIRGKRHLSYHSAQLNKLMHNHNITAPQRVLYIAGMILSMQSVMSNEYRILTKGLSPADLQGSQEDGLRDGELVFERIEEFLQVKVPDSTKRKLMLNSFNEIKKAPKRDEIPKYFTDKEGKPKNPNHKIIAHILKEPSSINKQIFAYIYTYIYSEIDGLNGHLDIMGECYSEFLKYALGDGKELGIVLTPPYVTKMMTQILDITSTDRVMDLATGSAGFLISSMEQMIEDVYKNTAKHSTQANKAILELKTKQLLGVEYNAEMFALATSNMILRGDGSSQIYNDNTFETEDSLYVSFAPTRILLNPPFTWDYNGLPFIEFGLDRMRPHGLGAIIIQDSAGNGQAIPITQSILKKHTLKASIKMPIDLFQPMAGVQTSIYIFEAKIPHDFEKPVKFIDFRNDGYKRTKRSLQEVDKPAQRYKDILKIYKQGLNAKLDNSVYEKPINLSEVYVEDFISESGADWNFDQHKKIDTTPTLADFKKCVSEYLAWEVSNVLKNQNSTQAGLEGNALSPRLRELETEFKQNGGVWRDIEIHKLFTPQNGDFDIQKIHLNDKGHQVVSAGLENNGVIGKTDIKARIFPKNTLTCDMFGNVFYRDFEYKMVTHARVMCLHPLFELNKKTGLYIASVMNYFKLLFSFADMATWSKIKNLTISLPVLNEQIAFDFMESYIKALEAERLQELEAYLKVTGLNDYTLSQKEKDALKAFENLSILNERERERVSGISHEMPLKALQDSTLTDSREWQSFANTALSALAQKELESSSAKNDIEWKSFKIGELFEIGTPKRKFNANELRFNGKYPYVARGDSNNGIRGYIDEDEAFLNEANTISFGQDTATIFYQTSPYFTGDKIKIFTFKKGDLDRYKANFLISVMKKAFANFSWGSSSFNVEILKNVCVLLPVLPTACHTEPLGEVSQVESKRDFSLATQTQNDKNVESSATQDYQIAFDFIESFIKAIQKECIKSVVLWQKREAEAYRACVKED
ncbi:restriction endonuclease subunit S [Campylobacter upsaliensis]|nr:restriction endonuclease subunit S [Campylobacter upsaliensis]